MERTLATRESFHSLDVTSAIDLLETDANVGLKSSEAERRLADVGPNKLVMLGRDPWPLLLARQFVSTLIIILIIAAAVAAAIGKTGDAITILAIVLLNGALGFAQEWRAQRALAALRQMLSPKATVTRDGISQEIEAQKLVPGDLVELKIGFRVPADIRLVETVNLKTEEAALTGESSATTKSFEAVSRDAPLAARSSMTFMGTVVVNGHAKGIVTATGMRTELGKVATLTQSIDIEETPLQSKLGQLGRQLGVAAVVVSALVAFLGWWAGKDLADMFMTGISLAVAAVPEGLPAVVTITLALGVRAMVRRRALLRNLQAAETLGAANVICTDKTGTLTKNEMTVTRIWLPTGEVTVTGIGYDPAGHFEMADGRLDYSTRADLLALLKSGLACNHARVTKVGAEWKKVGEATEAALVVAAYKAWLDPNCFERVGELSFNSRRKRMTVMTRSGASKVVAHVKGAPEVILERASHIAVSDRVRTITPEDRRSAERAFRSMAESGLRTLALARRELPSDAALSEEEIERDLTLLGIVALVDPPREEVPEAVATAAEAGIDVIMITGDAGPTAYAVARIIGLSANHIVTGPEIDQMNDAELLDVLRRGAIFARVAPEHKLRIVATLQAQDLVVAMTGDGVNDAPALKKADVGIAMGLRGTDVARGASDIVLTDDNFSSIIGAVEEGRRQYDNIKKFVHYVCASHFAEVSAILVNILLGGPLILLPVQILWMNLVTDGPTALSLGLEPAEKGLMRRPPLARNEQLIDTNGLMTISLLGTYIAAATVGLYYYYGTDGPAETALAQTVAFTAIIVLEKANVFNFRSNEVPLSVVGYFSNRWLLIAVFGTLSMQVAAVYIPFLQRALYTVPLAISDWVLIVSISLPIIIISELIKRRRWQRSDAKSGEIIEDQVG